MRRLAALALLLVVLAVAGIARPSGADFLGSSTNAANAFAAAMNFNTVAVSLADPGTPVQGTKTLTATASSALGITSVKFQRSPAGAGTWTTICSAGTAPYSCSLDSTALADGSYDLRALATDGSGYTATSLVPARVVDNVGPTVTLSDPGTYLQGTVGLQMNASDTVGLASSAIQYRATGAGSWTTLCTGGPFPRTCPLSTGSLPDGSYDLRATATDTGGHTASSTLTRTVDNTAPATAMTDPGAMRQTATLAATAVDGAGMGVSSVAIQYRLSPSGSWATACTTATSPYTCALNTTTLADGLYDFRSIATDATGLSTTSAVVTGRRIDNTAPTAAVTDPGAALRGSVTVAGTATDGGSGVASWTLQYRTSPSGTWTTVCTDTSPSRSCAWATTGLTDGLYDLRAIVADVAGNTTTSAVVSGRRVDNTAPAVTLTNPGSPGRGVVTLAATASDAGAGVTSVAFEGRLTGSSTWTTLCTDTTSNYSCTFDTATVPDGTYDLQARATDGAGNSATSVITALVIDNTPPTTTMTDPGAMRQTATLAATAADGTGSGVNSVAIQYRTSPSGTWTTACTKAAAPYTCSLNTTTLADGLYDFRSIATDVVGLSTTSAVITGRRIDNTAPTVTLTSPGTPLRGSVTVAGTATDGGSGVASWTLQYRTSPSGTWTTVCADSSSSYSCAWATTGVTDGLYDLQAIATDVAGNTTTSAVVSSRRVDNTAPAVALTDPGSPKTGTFTLSATSTDGGSGVSSVAFQRRVTGTTTWTTICTDNTTPFSCSFNSTTVGDDSYDFQALSTDAAGNTATSVVGARIINNTTPTPTDVNADNGTGTAGLVETGDTIEFDFNEPLQPATVMTGWNGSAGTAVTVRILDNANTDRFEIWNAANTTQTRLTSGGPVLAKALVNANITFNATLTQTSSGVYVITLGTIRAGSAGSAVAAGTVSLSWPAAAGFLDLAGTASVAKSVTGTRTLPF